MEYSVFGEGKQIGQKYQSNEGFQETRGKMTYGRRMGQKDEKNDVHDKNRSQDKKERVMSTKKPKTDVEYGKRIAEIKMEAKQRFKK